MFSYIIRRLLFIIPVALGIVTALLVADRLKDAEELSRSEVRAEISKLLFANYSGPEVLSFSERGITIHASALKAYLEHQHHQAFTTAA